MPSGSPPRSILITGASSGIGAALAEAYAAPGVFLALGGRSAERLETVAAKCRAKGAEVETRAVDVADRAAMSDWVGGTDDAHPLDLVIANAGISRGTAGSDGNAEKDREIFAVNVAGVLNTLDPVLPGMRARRRGHIAIMSSVAGFHGLPDTAAYAASKAAVRVYGEGLRASLYRDGIAVSVICPGWVESALTAVNKFPMPFMMTAPKAARIIQRGLARNKARIAFPFPMAFATWLLAAMPAAWSDHAVRRAPRRDE